MGSIYKITNIVNGKAYIGQTRNDAEKTRIREHLDQKRGGSRLVKRAVAKYGKDAFTVEILHDGIIPEFLDMLEAEAIAKYNTVAPNGYNLTAGGEGGSPSEETRQKIREARKRQVITMGTRQKMSKASKGRKHTAETREKLRVANLGKTHSRETREKLRVANLGNTRSEETKQKISESTTGEKHWNFGKKASEETRRRLSESHIGINAGEKHPMYGKTHTAETRRKLSEANKGRNHTPESRRKMSEANTGRTHTAETREKLRVANLGKTLSEEHRQKISEANTGRTHTPESIAKMSKTKESPERKEARNIFFRLPPDMPITEKRKHLHQKFPEKHRDTIRNWIKKFASEA